MTPSDKISIIKEKLEKAGAQKERIHKIVMIKACHLNDRYKNKSTIGVLINPDSNQTVNKAQLMPNARFESRSPINAARSFIDHRSQLSHHSQQPGGPLLEELPRQQGRVAARSKPKPPLYSNEQIQLINRMILDKDDRKFLYKGQVSMYSILP